MLHSLSKPPSPSGETAATSTELPEDTRKQVGEVLTLVRDLKDARALQTQQTTDIARCKLSHPYPMSRGREADIIRLIRVEFLVREIRRQLY